MTLIKVNPDVERIFTKGNLFGMNSKLNLEDNPECNKIEHQKLRNLILEKKSNFKNQINYFESQKNKLIE